MNFSKNLNLNYTILLNINNINYIRLIKLLFLMNISLNVTVKTMLKKNKKKTEN